MATQHANADRSSSSRSGSTRPASSTEPLRHEKPASSGRSGQPTPTHEQIEQRAKAIWEQRGRHAGEDEKNWYEAETQLKRELAGK